jgi:tripartite-type tricarboxylate transporter receptor subunit TctC
MGRPIVAPAAVPPDRVKILRESFLKTLADPALQQEAAKLGLEIDPMPGEAVQALITKIYAAPKETIEAVRTLIVSK